MNQVITQHGWGLDQSFWDSYKVEFQKNGWHWQNNERGYFSKSVNQSKWVKNNFNDQIDIVDVFRPSNETPGIAKEAVEKKGTVLWLQYGIENDEAKKISQQILDFL